ncbi:MAG: hypothetical protein R2854_23870 [Caldilineaceae bacterium]
MPEFARAVVVAEKELAVEHQPHTNVPGLPAPRRDLGDAWPPPKRYSASAATWLALATYRLPVAFLQTFQRQVVPVEKDGAMDDAPLRR